MSNTRKKHSSGQRNKSISYFEILKKIAFTNQLSLSQQTANEYLNRSQGEGVGEVLQYIIRGRSDQDVLELFLRGLENKNISDIALPNNIGMKANPLTECVGIQNDALLGVMLHYGAKPNKEFWVRIKGETSNKKFLELPPLLNAFLNASIADIRLLVLYGASLDCIAFDKLHPKSQIHIFPEYRVFYDNVCLEVAKLRTMEAKAQELERNNNYESAFALYKKIGNFYLGYATSCQSECKEEISKKTLPVFYIRLALIPFARALCCLEQSLKNPILTPDELSALQVKVQKFYEKVFEIAEPIRTHEFLNVKFQPIIDSVERFNAFSLQLIQSGFEKTPVSLFYKNGKEYPEGLHRRKPIKITDDEQVPLLTCR